MTGRIDTTFVKAKKAGRGTLGVFVTAGDPNAATTSALLDALVEIGVEFIELGMPFSDPMADGPAIQAASLRALKGGMTLSRTLDIAADFRKRHPNTPLILMGYYNPIYMYGNDRFITNALAAGVDGLIVVDLPPEEDKELCLPAKDAGLKFIRLVTPTSDETRLPAILAEASGFIYYVSVLGITGTKSADRNTISDAYQLIRAHTELPIVAGFGIRTPAQAAEAAGLTDGAVVGSAVVDIIANNLTDMPQEGVDDDIVQKVATFVDKLTKAISKEGMR